MSLVSEKVLVTLVASFDKNYHPSSPYETSSWLSGLINSLEIEEIIAVNHSHPRWNVGHENCQVLNLLLNSLVFTLLLQSCEILEASVDSTFFSQSLRQTCDPRKCYQYDNHCLCCTKSMTVGKNNLSVINKAFAKLQSRQGLFLSVVLFCYFLLTTILNCLIFAG